MVNSGSAFPTVSSDTLDFAKKQCLHVLNNDLTPERVRKYYDVDTNYAGATFAGLKPNAAGEITDTDLLAVTTLSVDIPVLAVRRILEDNAIQSKIHGALEALAACALEDTVAQSFPSMEAFYDLVKSLLAKADTKSSNPWVTASKIAARKRPDLFPVRDRVVCKLLGIHRHGDRAKDWVVYRELMRDEEVRSALSAAVAKAEAVEDQREVNFDLEPLRQLDVALWSAASKWPS
ncbi:DUF6308 family protein [Brevibacterium sp. BDJS002]|uniref:DUF6308 family protein n=1 Tax=Brevibacterium sp. BDJS002 TaxID=3020906 RepID=UPI0023076FD3|nr:DUF6308 family protein [Brevibacterium sp. BDJS002]WCE38830.1 DUF6308 family protein [Brevibacterium sp. BDJS002]